MCSIAMTNAGAGSVDTGTDDGAVVSLPAKDTVETAVVNEYTEDISSPITAQVFDFCETKLYPVETLQNSKQPTSSSDNCSYDDNSSYTANLTFPSDIGDKIANDTVDFISFQTDHQNETTITMATTTTTATSSTTTTTTTTTTANNNNNNNTLSIIFDAQDELDNDISASIDFSTSPPPPSFLSSSYANMSMPLQTDHLQLDFTTASLQLPSSQIQLTDHHHQVSINDISCYPSSNDPTIPLMGTAAAVLPSVFDEDCLSTIPSLFRMNNPTGSSNSSSSSSYSYMDPSLGPYLSGALNAALGVDNTGMFSGAVLVGSDMQGKEPDYHGDNNGGMYCPDQLQRVYNSGDVQGLSNESQQMVNGPTGSTTPLSTEISSLEDSTFKVGKLSVEQRKEKIHRYMKKRNERNFSKKIKYACRKTLADSRPRVRGRFAKNDDFGEAHRHTGGQHDEDDYDEVNVKEEDDLVHSDIFAHITGVNSFKCGYSIQPWTLN